MRGVERVADLPRDIDHSRERQRTFVADHLLERLAAQKLHHEKDVSAFVFAKVSNTQRVWM